EDATAAAVGVVIVRIHARAPAVCQGGARRAHAAQADGCRTGAGVPASAAVVVVPRQVRADAGADGSRCAGTRAAQAVWRRRVSAPVAAGAAVACVCAQIGTGPAAAIGQPLIRAAAVAAGTAVVGIGYR